MLQMNNKVSMTDRPLPNSNEAKMWCDNEIQNLISELIFEVDQRLSICSSQHSSNHPKLEGLVGVGATKAESEECWKQIVTVHLLLEWEDEANKIIMA